ncbi:uncharacterized protein C10orf82-like [Haliotis rubra]|uniref:uncharacterized protein C10orf82-like n=1 Tax=Haliotis rubra TaxID=36100 RepID=UPI001EE58D20|nr:uncharacterized protein C10orf82-like [Haliotis rubra]
MTTVAFGGGPTVEQRRAFAQLKEGTQVPGYRGYVPQIKYRVGQTYGNDTHDLLKSDHEFRRSATIMGPFPQETLKNELPDATGDNKYTKNMVPGYTGYIPRMPFKFGGTYKDDCDVCIDTFMSNTKNHDFKMRDLQRQIRSYPRLTAISHDPTVRDKLNLYRDTHPTQPMLLEDKRSLTEAPMPGYQGYVPRIRPTELGLGCRYHESSKIGFNAFVQETQRHKELQSDPNYKITVNRPPAGPRASQSAPSNFSRRLYLQDGMIPKYTGYVPQRRYAFGNTYGDTTRSMDVCSHGQDSFGTHVKTVRFSQAVE